MGQSKKKRSCPALNQPISPADCGANRLAKYACPGTCEYNPFSARNYDALMSLEDILDRKTLAALSRLHPDPHGFARTQHEARRAYGPAGEFSTAMRAIFDERDPFGRTVAERWLATDGASLSNDERVLLRAKMQFQPALIEVQRVVDEHHLEVINLFDPERRTLTILDRSIAATVGRFTSMLVWMYPLSHIWRVGGAGFEPPEIPAMSPATVVDACIRHLGGPIDPQPRATWLWSHFEELTEAFQAVDAERRRRQFAVTDATVGQASYALEVPLAECLAMLASHPDIDPEDPGPELAAEGFQAVRVWLAAATGTDDHQVRHLLGRLLFKADTLRVDAIGGARLDDLKAKAEALLGPRIRFTAERRDDMAARFLQQIPPPDAALVPPELLEQVGPLQLSSSIMPPPQVKAGEDHMLDIRRDLLRTLLDEKVPALDHHTPREAAKHPALRPALVEWTKGLIRLQDMENLRTGTRDDLMNQVVRELDLPELDIEPPPLRKPPADDMAPWEDGPEDLIDDEGDILEDAPPPNPDWSAPSLPPKPLTREEAALRLQMAMHVMPTAAAAIDAIDDSGNPLLDRMTEILERDLDEGELELALAIAAQLWFALVPRGQRPLLRYDHIAEAYERGATSMSKISSPKSAEQLIIEGSPQPGVMMNLAALVVTAGTSEQRAHQVRPAAGMAIIFGLKALLGELDHALRQ